MDGGLKSAAITFVTAFLSADTLLIPSVDILSHYVRAEASLELRWLNHLCSF